MGAHVTVIAALHENGETWIGADSQRSYGNLRITPVDKLIFSPDRSVAIGFAGFERTNLLVNHNLSAVFASSEPFAIANAVRALVKEDGYSGAVGRNEHNGPLGWGCDALIATLDGVWFMAEDSAVTKIQPGALWACGSGMEYAIGAGNAQQAGSPAQRVSAAIEISIRFDKGCGAPVQVHRVGVATPVLMAAQ